jgi:hypothetical protein
MKKLIIPLCLLLCSCSCKYELITRVIDYSKICDNKNFFLTESNSVSFEYKALGSISTECISGDKKMTKLDDAEVYLVDVEKYKEASIEDAYKDLIKTAVEKGANGLINLQSRYIGAYSTNFSFFPSRWIVTGMMIRK